MTGREDRKSRETRLAEALRANLLRRKAQARAQAAPTDRPPDPKDTDDTTPPR